LAWCGEPLLPSKYNNCVLRSLTLLALTLPLHAQFAEIASTDDGEQVYFTTQALLKNAPRPIRPFSELRAYRVVSSGLELFAERGDLARTDGFGSGDGVTQLQVSGDGQSVAYTLNQICIPNEPCNRTFSRSEVRGRYARTLGDGTTWMSRNGEWALFTPAVIPANRPGEQPQRPTESTLINLRTGERSGVPVPVIRGNPLTSDGSVLTAQGPVLGIVTKSEFRPIQLPPGVWSPLRISDNGRRLFLLLQQRTGPRLYIHDLSSNTSTVVSVYAESELTELLGVSNNGDWALVKFVIPEQANRAGQGVGRAAVIDTETGRQVDSGRFLRFDLDSRGNVSRTRELLAPSPYVCCGDLRLSPGDVSRLNIVAPGVSDWTNRIRIGNTPLPVLASDASSVTVQTPWETPITGMTELTLDFPSDGPFSTTQRAFVTVALPRFAPAEPNSGSLFPGVKLVKADFSDYVKTPPRPGEIVHVYMTGLGPVRGSVATGQPAPINDIRPITGTIRCQFLPNPASAETLFAGLAPGTLGYYLLTLRMPAEMGSGPLTGMNCQFATEGFSSNMSYIQLPTLPPPQ
jgi:uncharacterized protein (TIGR03437 family)